ncbi:Alpha/Beta hydrolase protein [Suillus paluster]|uniref:Alpha/Beta hydrolase protein n=1 Tax=Suillus paluster TaxID=48578 RepID=UPI001B868CCB|nr:Alpha/Beta hydrolase protein [Suillus paluster]KAG1751286.1 Alpha/Beta hydrolase protein [Suillus paluster]
MHKYVLLSMLHTSILNDWYRNPPDDTSRPLRSSWKWPHFPGMHDPSDGIPEEVYKELVRYTKYASGAYQVLCPRPMGNVLVTQFTDVITATQGFVARDDTRNELVVSFRGSREITSAIIDTSLVLSTLRGPGLPKNTDAHVHTGFLYAFKSVGEFVLDALREQFEKYPQYDVVGAIACIAALSIRNSFPEVALRLFTLGQPRTGDHSFAELVEIMIGIDNIFRGVHSFGMFRVRTFFIYLTPYLDGVPTMIPTRLGYRHHATEYWQFTEPPAPRHVRRCVGGEDPEGSASIPSTGINLPHMVYFEQHMGKQLQSDPTVCI